MNPESSMQAHDAAGGTATQMSRRWLLVAGVAALLGRFPHVKAARSVASAEEAIAAIHKRIGGRLGVHALDTETGTRVGFDDRSRYAMASTFKWLLVAAILARVDRGELSLEQAVTFGEKDMLPHAPVTSKLLSKGSASIRELCAAIVEVGDNPAANLLLRLIDGPAGLTRYIRSLGDTETRLDRYEPDLNANLPGDPRDTTTPRAMVNCLEHVLTRGALSTRSRELLTSWLVSSITGLQRIRAGLPSGWMAGDKTGTGANGAANDVAIAWPPGRKPLLIAIYMSESSLDMETLSAAHSEIARVLVSALAS